MSTRMSTRLAWPLAAVLIGVPVLVCAYHWVTLGARQAEATVELERRNEVHTRLINHAVDQQLDAILRSIDAGLRQLRTAYVANPAAFDQAAQEFLAAYPRGMLQFVTVFGADGYLAYSSNGSAERLHFGDREHFRVHAESAGDRLFISKPIVGRIANVPLIQLTRPIRRDGRLVGVIGIPLRPDYLSKQLYALHLNPEDTIAVVRPDGSFIARSRSLDEALRTTVPPDRPFLTARPGEEGFFRSVSTVDRVPLLFSWSRSADWPLAVAVAFDEGPSRRALAVAQAETRRDTLVGISAVMVFSLGIALLVLRMERKNRALASSEARFRELFEANQSVMLLIDPASDRIVDANAAAGSFYGYTREALVGMQLADLNRPSRAAAPADGPGVPGRPPAYREAQHRLASGSLRHVEVYSTPIERDGATVLFWIIQDVTLRKEAEAQRRESEMLLTSAIDAIDEAFVVYDADDRLVYCNQRYRDVYPGIADVITEGRSFGEIIRIWADRGLADTGGRDVETWIATRMAFHRDGGVLVQRTEAGRWLRIVERRTAENYVVGFRVDITELAQAREDAKAASVAKSRFLATMSHELRTPMNGILGMAQLLAEPGVSDAERQEYAQVIVDCGHTLLVLLNDILDLSKVEAGKFTLAPASFDPDSMLRDVQGLFAEPARAKSIGLGVRWEGPAGSLYVGDPHRLRQMLANLVGNAIKFTARGEIRICAREVASVGVRRLLEFAVTDTGIGVPRDQQALLFDGSVRKAGHRVRVVDAPTLPRNNDESLARRDRCQ